MLIEAVQIISIQVSAKITLIHTIWVYHRDQDKMKILPKHCRPEVFFVEQKSHHSFHAKGRRSFSRVHASRHQYLWFAYLERPSLIL